jgi:hypothetical protein
MWGTVGDCALCKRNNLQVFFKTKFPCEKIFFIRPPQYHQVNGCKKEEKNCITQVSGKNLFQNPKSNCHFTHVSNLRVSAFIENRYQETE